MLVLLVAPLVFVLLPLLQLHSLTTLHALPLPPPSPAAGG